MRTIRKSAVCEECSRPFEHEILEDWPDASREICESCTRTMESKAKGEKLERENAEHLAFRISTWEEIVPLRYQRTQLDHPDFYADLWTEVKKWRPTDAKPWLGLVGPPGVCKTRVAALRLKNAMIEETAIPRRSYGKPVANVWDSTSPRSDRPLFITSYQFAQAVLGQYADDRATKEKARFLLRACADAAWLVFDDIGKAKSTPAISAALFAMIDHRHGENLATIWTANSFPEVFCQGMSDDIAGPLVRRLKELSVLLNPE